MDNLRNLEFILKKVWNHEFEAAVEYCAQVIYTSGKKPQHCNIVDLKYSGGCSGEAEKGLLYCSQYNFSNSDYSVHRLYLH